jgi:hypothetical protein
MALVELAVLVIIVAVVVWAIRKRPGKSRDEER